MKKSKLLFVPLIIVSIYLQGCSTFTVGIKHGYIDKEEYFDTSASQDTTDYCKYYYPQSNTIFSKSRTYKLVKEDDIDNIRSYFIDFAHWMDVEDRTQQYDFDLSIISKGDYIYIKTKEGKSLGNSKYDKFDNYSVYFYDTESATLFYIHSNI